MSEEKFQFTGKEVTDAIKKACDDLGVPQERLDIEVIETGSTGIFGLIRKKAKIQVSIKEELEEEQHQQDAFEKAEKKPAVESKKVESITSPSKSQEAEKATDFGEDVSPESVALIEKTLGELLEAMEFPSTVSVSSEGSEVFCHISGEYEEYLTGQDGRTLDSIQYLLRKIVARKTPERLKLSVDVGDFREKRLENLKQEARELAELVKADGKTQVIAALNPSERRVVHLILQEDKEIRSRSVGDGLFKKILIYKPGKGGKSDPRKRSNKKNKRGRRPKTSPDSE